MPERSEKIVVGRRAGNKDPEPVALHPLVLERARAGKSVLRLKCGDPMIFGRGGEECALLHEAGIPFEVIPGVTAASGAAARSLIPLTQRGLASDVTLATAHRAGGAKQNLVDWASLPKRGTIVLYMVAHHLKINLERLIEHGRSPETPCAFILNATQPNEQVIQGTLENLAGKIKEPRSRTCGPGDHRRRSLCPQPASSVVERKLPICVVTVKFV